MIVHRWRSSVFFRPPVSITPFPFTIACPNVPFPQGTTYIHKSKHCTETPPFWKAAAICSQQFWFGLFLEEKTPHGRNYLRIDATHSPYGGHL